MAKELGVLVIHGIGSQSGNFAEKMIHEVENRLRNAGKDVTKIAWEPVHWADVTEKNQLKYIREVNQANIDLDLMSLRKFIIKSLGDASAYQKTSSADNQTYERVNDVVKAAMKRLYQVLGSEDKPLILMAHSLGGYIMSCNVWDTRKSGTETGFKNFDTVKQIITFGCNLPLFSFAYDDPKPIEIPNAKWHNYYDTDDVLGYPLKQISSHYDRVVDADIEINVGNVITSWNPASHTAYWEDNDFTKITAGHIEPYL